MLEVNKMSTEELKVWYKELSEAFEGMERGSYEYDCTDADLQSVWEVLRQRGVR